MWLFLILNSIVFGSTLDELEIEFSEYINELPYGIGHSAFAWWDETIWSIAGMTKNGLIDKIYRWTKPDTFADNQYRNFTQLPVVTPKQFYCYNCQAKIGHYIYIVTPYVNSNEYNYGLRYVFDTNQDNIGQFINPDYHVPELMHKTAASCVTANGDYLFVIGGLMYNVGYTNYVQILDLSMNEWINGTNITVPLPDSRAYGSCATFNDYVYYFGGKNDNGIYDTIFKYNGVMSMNSSWYSNANVTLSNPSIYGKTVNFDINDYEHLILIINGYNDETQIISNIIDVYDTLNDKILHSVNMTIPRYGCIMANIDEQIFIFGGKTINDENTIYTSKSEYSNLLTNSPTTGAPTMITQSPTTSSPTVSTSNPSKHPTLTPTMNTNAPSKPPTISRSNTSNAFIIIPHYIIICIIISLYFQI